VGERDFFEVLVDTLCRHGEYDCGEVNVFYRTRRPRPIASRIKLNGRKVDPAAYYDVHYRNDPMYRAYLGGAPPGCYLLAGIEPEQSGNAFFTEYYEHTRITHEIDLLIPQPGPNHADAALVIWLGRHDQGDFRQHPDHMALAAMEPILHALVKRHVALAGIGEDANFERSLVEGKLQTAFHCFASSLLSERECQILRYMLLGYSAAMTGERLGICEGTVKNHRKNIHRKLEINTQSELFSLFLQALPYAEIGLSIDPLALCENRHGPGAHRLMAG
jgi:DNA-binding CsgD family transcriptional regulator